MSNSRDNVNRLATVKCFAYDGLGDIVDQHEAHGKLEPAIQFLDFMMECQSEWGAKITRYTCEVAYVLAMAIFLSSIAQIGSVHARSIQYASIPATPSDVHSISLRNSGAYGWLFTRSRPTAEKNAFQRSHEPILWLVPWPPFSEETETSKWYNIVHTVMVQPPPEDEKPNWPKKLLSVTAGLTGVSLLFYFLGFRRFRHFK